MTRLPIVRLSQAEEDLIGIWQHVAVDSPAAADRLLDRIDAACVRLSDFPLSAPARDDILPGIRQLVTGNYLVFYRADSDAVTVVRVLHGHRDVEPDDLAAG